MRVVIWAVTVPLMSLMLDVLAVLALLLPRPRGFGVVLGALIFGLAHDLVSLRSRRLLDGAGVPTATMDLIGSPVRSPLVAM